MFHVDKGGSRFICLRARQIYLHGVLIQGALTPGADMSRALIPGAFMPPNRCQSSG